jgi:hypothetical protein
VAAKIQTQDEKPDPNYNPCDAAEAKPEPHDDHHDRKRESGAPDPDMNW